MSSARLPLMVESRPLYIITVELDDVVREVYVVAATLEAAAALARRCLLACYREEDADRGVVTKGHLVTSDAMLMVDEACPAQGDLDPKPVPPPIHTFRYGWW